MARRGARRPERRVIVAGQALSPGTHRISFAGGAAAGADAADVRAMVIVGARKGPRVFVVGGRAREDGLGAAVVRGLVEQLTPGALAGAVILVPAAGEAEGDAAVRAALFEKATCGIELRAGAIGRATVPHVRADLRDARTARLARAFGTEVIVGTPGTRGSLRRAASRAGVVALTFEAGELGRRDADAESRGVEGVLSVLRTAGLLAGKGSPSVRRAVGGERQLLRAPRSGWVAHAAAPGAIAQRGEPLALLGDATGAIRATIDAPARVIVLAVCTGARVIKGEIVARVARLRAATRPPAPPPAPPPPPVRVGWCEWIALPDLRVTRLHAKIDTGARTSALHVLAMRPVAFDDAGREVLEIRLPGATRGGIGRRARVTVVEYVHVRDSGGHSERRPVIETTLALGPHVRPIRLTLTDRGDMIFPMLVGRSALGHDVVIDATSRDLLGRPR